MIKILLIPKASNASVVSLNRLRSFSGKRASLLLLEALLRGRPRRRLLQLLSLPAYIISDATCFVKVRVKGTAFPGSSSRSTQSI